MVFLDFFPVKSLLWHVLGIDDGAADVTNIHHAQDDECSWWRNEKGSVNYENLLLINGYYIIFISLINLIDIHEICHLPG